MCWNLQTFSTEVVSGDILWYLSTLDELLHRTSSESGCGEGEERGERSEKLDHDGERDEMGLEE